MKKLLLGSGLILAATGAVAQVAPVVPGDGIETRAEVVQRTRAMFERVDANRDGFITQDEGQALRARAMRDGGMRGQRTERAADPARRTQMFDRLDTDRNNMISREEWTRAEALRGERMAKRGPMDGAMLRQADTNRDQRISLAEAEAAALQRFDRADVNRDGRVTQEERQQLRQRWQGQRPAARN